MKKIVSSLFFTCHIVFGFSQELPQFQGDFKELFAVSDSTINYASWIKRIEQWRAVIRDSLHLNSSAYAIPALKWERHSFIYAQMMVEDRYFYNPVAKQYTVDKYLNDLDRRYGGIDAVLIWPTYPNIGIDNRNQFDLLNDMPGGIDGVKKMVSAFHKRGVAVFFPIMYWDRGTHPFGKEMAYAIIQEMKFIGADGLNGDTMYGVDSTFWKASKTLHYPIVLQPEASINDLKMLNWNQMSWGYYWPYSYSPGVSVYKWLEPEHQVFVTDRWTIDRTDILQYAFFNGIGFNTWENVWGIWNQIPQRFEEAIKRISSIYKSFSEELHSPDWQPEVPVLQKGVFASAFPGDGKTLYTFINRDSADKTGDQIILPRNSRAHYFDLWNGEEIKPEQHGNYIALSFPIEANGYSALLVLEQQPAPLELRKLLKKMQDYAQYPLRTFPDDWQPLQQQMIDKDRVSKYTGSHEGMILIPSIKKFPFESIGVMIEGDDLPDAVGVQHPWEQHPSRSQKHDIDIRSFYIDKYPVTNREFKVFMDATHYRPDDDHNFLKDWKHGIYPEGWGDKPVTWVSIEDARAYAVWAGKRLPHEWEWQYAAQGKNVNVYPWGNVMDSSKLPKMDTSRLMRSPSSVNEFPEGASIFGVGDLVGNIWQWTDEYRDEHTRAAVLKGGGCYHPQTSDWYFPDFYELNKYGKYLLMSPGKDRSATIGFRCVKDTLSM